MYIRARDLCRTNFNFIRCKHNPVCIPNIC